MLIFVSLSAKNDDLLIPGDSSPPTDENVRIIMQVLLLYINIFQSVS